MKNLFRSKRLRMALALTLAVMLLLPVMASAATAFVATRSSGLNLREGPGTGYSVVRSFPKGTQVEILSSVNGWAYVYVGGYYGYMSERYLSTAYNYGPTFWYPCIYQPADKNVYGYIYAEGKWWPVGANGLPIGTKLNPWGPLSGFHYPWEPDFSSDADK